MAGSSRQLPELVRDSELTTKFRDGHTVHYFPDAPKNKRREVWKRAKRAIGVGSFGEVWREDCVDGNEPGAPTRRAVKVIRLISRGELRLDVSDYSRELEALAKFSHRKYSSCFVKSHGWFRGPDLLCISLEYLPLGDLRAYLSGRGSQVSQDEARQITSHLLSGLKFMHEEGFAHRDLKPANVLIKSHPPTGNWWVVLSDFGLSKRVEHIVTGTSGMLGTPGYMAPELYGFHNEQLDLAYDSCDIWCIGEMTFQMITGHQTFASQAMLFRYARGESEFPTQPLTDFSPPVDQRAVDFVTLLMRANPRSRPTANNALLHPWIAEINAEYANSISGTELAAFPSGLEEGGMPTISTSSGLLSQTSTEYRAWTSTKSTGNADESLGADELQNPVGLDRISSADLDVRYNPFFDSTKGPVETRGSLPRPISTERVMWREEISGLLRRRANSRMLRKEAFHVTDVRNERESLYKPTVLSFANSETLAVATSTTVDLWNVKARSVKCSIRHGTRVTAEPPCIAISPDSRSIALASSESTEWVVCVWDTSTGEETFKCGGHRNRIACISFNHDGTVLAFASLDCTIHLWDLVQRDDENPKLQILVHKSPVTSLSFFNSEYFPDHLDRDTPRTQSVVVSASHDGIVRFWDIDHMSLKVGHDKNPKHMLETHKRNITSMAISPQGDWIALAFDESGRPLPNLNIQLWNLDASLNNSEHHCWTLTSRHQYPVQGLVFFREMDSKHLFLVTASIDSIEIRATTSTPGAFALVTRIMRFKDSLQFRSLAVSPDRDASSQLAFVTSYNVKTMQVWNTEQITKLHRLQTHFDTARFWAISPDRTYAASVAENTVFGTTVMIWDTRKVTPCMFIQVSCGHGSREAAVSVSFSSDSTKLGCVSDHSIVRVWDVSSGRQLKRKDMMPPDGWRLSVPYRVISEPNLFAHAAVYNNILTPEPRHIVHIVPLAMDPYYEDPKAFILPRETQDEEPLALAFSHNGHRISEVSKSGIIVVWDIRFGMAHATARINADWTVFSRPLQDSALHGYCSIAFSPNDNAISLFSGFSNTIQMWDLHELKSTFQQRGTILIESEDENNPTAGRESNPAVWISPDWTRCVTYWEKYSHLELWDIAAGKGQHVFINPLRGGTMGDVRFSPDSRLLAVVSYDIGVMSIWYVETGRLMNEIDIGKGNRRIFFWPDSKRVVTTGDSNSPEIHIWDVKRGNCIRFEGHNGNYVIDAS